MDGLGTGLAALAFWGVVAAFILGGIWDGAKKREAQHETLRRIIESGKPVDQTLMDKLLGQARQRPDRDLRIGAIIVLSIAPGVAILGAFVSTIAPRALMPMLGAGALLACVGVGLLLASRYARRSEEEDLEAAGRLPREN